MKKMLLGLLIGFVLISACTQENIISYNYTDFLEYTENSSFKITKLTIYGKYFNLEGIIDQNIEYEKINLVFKDNEEEEEYSLFTETNENGLIFKTNQYINEGINLEKLAKKNYLILLKIINSNEIKYYNLINNSDYNYVDYYTITKNNHNNHLTISFKQKNDIDFMYLEFDNNVKNDVCDIVLDPGHGGKDSGATNGGYYEKTYNLEYAKTLKEALEERGLKVRLTRDDDYNPDSYGVGSRTGIPYECSAKLMLSIHLNSNDARIKNGGSEIYMANGDNSTFAKILTDNITKNTNIGYSPNPYFRVVDGVYIRTYTKSDLKAVSKDAQKDGWTMYESANTSTTYYYFIRETGGIITGAFTDGRNPKNNANPYYLSNHGTEAYLVELGYISDTANLKEILNNKEGYIKGIIESIEYYINN